MPSTAVKPSSSGRPAATSAPNATSRMISVIGSERNSARWKSSSNASPSSFSADASPNSPTVTWGCARWTCGDRVERALDDVLGGVLVAGEVEVDQRGAAVGGDVVGELARERVLDLADALRPAERVDGVVDGGLELRVLHGQAVLALDEHGLGRRPRGSPRPRRSGRRAWTLRCPCPRRRASSGRPCRRGRSRGSRRRTSRGSPSCDVARSTCRRAQRGCGTACGGEAPGEGRDVPGNVSELPAAGPLPLRGLPVSCGAASLTGRWGWPRACFRAG